MNVRTLKIQVRLGPIQDLTVAYSKLNNIVMMYVLLPVARLVWKQSVWDIC